MRNRIRINEAAFKRIVAESVRGVLSEISPELKAAAAMTAAHRAQNTNDPYYNVKYRRQANKFAKDASDSYERENPEMDDVYFDPYDRYGGASFKRRGGDGSTIRYEYDGISDDAPNIYHNVDFRGDDGKYHYDMLRHYFDTNTMSHTKDEPEDGFLNDPHLSDNELRRYGRFKGKVNKAMGQLRGYQPKD